MLGYNHARFFWSRDLGLTDTKGKRPFAELEIRPIAMTCARFGFRELKLGKEGRDQTLIDCPSETSDCKDFDFLNVRASTLTMKKGMKSSLTSKN